MEGAGAPAGAQTSSMAQLESLTRLAKVFTDPSCGMFIVRCADQIAAAVPEGAGRMKQAVLCCCCCSLWCHTHCMRTALQSAQQRYSPAVADIFAPSVHLLWSLVPFCTVYLPLLSCYLLHTSSPTLSHPLVFVLPSTCFNTVQTTNHLTFNRH
jgi:hypothetical protein